MTKKQNTHARTIECVVNTEDLTGALKFVSVAVNKKDALLATAFIRLSVHESGLILMANNFEIARTIRCPVIRGPANEMVVCPKGKLFKDLIEQIVSPYLGLSLDTERHALYIFKLTTPDDTPGEAIAAIPGIDDDSSFTLPLNPNTLFQMPGKILSSMIGHVLPACSPKKELKRPEDSVMFWWDGVSLTSIAFDKMQLGSTSYPLNGDKQERQEWIVYKGFIDDIRKGIEPTIHVGASDGSMFLVGQHTVSGARLFGNPHILTYDLYTTFMNLRESALCKTVVSRSDLINLINMISVISEENVDTQPVAVFIQDGHFIIQTPKSQIGRARDSIPCEPTDPWKTRIDLKRFADMVRGCDTNEIAVYGLSTRGLCLEEIGGEVHAINVAAPLTWRDDL